MKKISIKKVFAVVTVTTLSMFNANAQTALSGGGSNTCGTAAGTGTGANNTAVGCGAGNSTMTGGYNTFVGNSAGISTTSAGSITAVGYQAGASVTTGTNNTYVGVNAGALNTTGSNNTAVGKGAGTGVVSGTDNTCIGVGAGAVQTNSKLTAVGSGAAHSETNGIESAYFGYNSGNKCNNTNDNAFFGYESGLNNTSGGGNTILGSYTGVGNTSGYDNVFVGSSAGNTNTTGAYNTSVGYLADMGAGTYTNSASFGYGAVSPGNDKIQIGNASITNVYCQPNAWGSDGRFKTNVTENVKGLAFINKLRPVTYHLDTKAMDDFIIKNMSESAKAAHKAGMDFKKSTAIIHSGFIAQEVEQAAKQVKFTSSIVVTPENSNEYYALSYAEFVVPLVKAVQELSNTIDSLKNILDSKARENKKQDNINKGNTDGTGINIINTIELTNIRNAIIYQNAPNPFGDGTSIKYFIPDNNSANTQIVFYDQFGSPLNTFTITETGNGQLNINAGSLASGTYSYSLILNGKVVDTKKMIKQ